MTDDDRMDRAERIRQMREGTRQESDESTGEDAPDDGPNGDGSPDAADVDDGSPEDSAGGEPAAGATVTGDGGTATEQASSTSHNDSGGDSDDATTDSGDAATERDDAATDSDENDGEDGGMHIPGADVDDVDVDVEKMAEQAGLETGGASEDVDDAAAAPGPAGIEAEASRTTEETRVLEFSLGDEQYCLDINYIEEIVKRETVTRVPNTPDYVEGVVDLRGQITTIIDPKVPLEIDDEGSQELIVVFDPEAFEDQGAIGWIVDDVNQVIPITEDEVNDPPIDDEHVRGVVDRDDQFVIWTTPDLALEEAEG